MTNEQVKELFKRIKANYDIFSNNKEKFDEWCRILKDYSYIGVSKNFDKWLKEANTEPPIATQLVNEFIREYQKEAIMYCKYCKKPFSLNNFEDYENHIARHNSIIYIKSKENLIDKVFDIQKLLNMGTKEFNLFYEEFQDIIVDLVQNEIQRKRLQNCILTRDGGEIEITPELYNIKGDE